MGSFTEGVLSFSFRTDTPDDVLAAFAALAAPGTPPLPPPVPADADGMMPTDYAQDDDELAVLPADPFPGEPWRHDWAAPLSASMGVMFVGEARLWWGELQRWTLTARFSWKDDPERVARAIRWLGPHIETTNGTQPLLLGYLRHEYDPRPLLVWHDGDRVYTEDLRAAERRCGVLEVVCGLPGSGYEQHLAAAAARGERIADRFHEASVDHDPHPLHSRYAGAVLRALDAGEPVVVYDAAFCATATRERLTAELRRHLPELVVVTTSFANDPELCRRNVTARGSSEPGHDIGFELRQIERFTTVYEPVGDVRPVLPYRGP